MRDLLVAPLQNNEDDEEDVQMTEVDPSPDVPEMLSIPVAEMSESTGTGEDSQDALTGKISWTIPDFSKITTKRMYSDVFEAGGYKWRILLFPKGSNQEYQASHLAIFLDVVEDSTLVSNWSRDARFSIAVVNQVDAAQSFRKECDHRFTSREQDWGFQQFLSLQDLFDVSKGFLVDDRLIIEAHVAVQQDYWLYDSKKSTGYVGLKNQGATCYMNSLLQTLYHIPYFRKAVYNMPTTESEVPSLSIPLALQSLFYKLQYTDTSASTKELTKSFGWDASDSFMQHDVQELNRVLCEKLEEKMKGTVVENTIQHLFEGHHMNYIECVNVDYKSTRKESFYDLQLDVKGCKNVYESFDKYVAVEQMEGDNKYQAEQFGLQDARKGVSFIDFPPVLQLQLKRFEYDFAHDSMVKINDRYEFPLDLDLDREDGKYLSPDANRSVKNKYTLHSVLVHSGGVHGGHYYAFIRPGLGNQWFKFDDERVTKESSKRALEDQYGDKERVPIVNQGFNTYKSGISSNAYMLVYVRVSDKDKIICDASEADMSEHLQIRLRREQEEKEKKRKEKAEAHLYTIIRVARHEDLREQIGQGGYNFDLVDHERVKTFRIPKENPFKQLMEEVAQDWNVPESCQRYWLWAKRQNQTFRPSRPLTADEQAMTVSQLRDLVTKNSHANGVAGASELKLLLETPPDAGPDNPGRTLPERRKDDLLLFFKLYDPEKEVISYVCHLFFPSGSKPTELRLRLCEAAGFASKEELMYFEEIKFEPEVLCEPLEPTATLKEAKLEDGDIICFQKAVSKEEESRYRHPTVVDFFYYVKHRQVVRFRRLEKPKEDAFEIEMSTMDVYDTVVEKLAQRLDLDDPTKLRLSMHNCYTQIPKTPPVKYRQIERLTDLLYQNYNQATDIVYFEVLDLPLPELQMLKTLKIHFHNNKTEEVSVQTVRLPRQSNVGELLAELKTKVETMAELRLLEVYANKIYKVFAPTDAIDNINDTYWTLRAEEVVDVPGPHDRQIHVYHVTRETQQPNATTVHVLSFGDPFLFVARENETLAQVKERIREKLEVPEEEFAKKREIMTAWDDYLGLEHADANPKKRPASQTRYTSMYEKPVKIHT
eukprot:TRINITY_DN8549_c0_g1_i1.p1 TRINITY_DN8549_c0_g1~~TRINITY_DN8549_c0_g1_i1.p1  ORF type:complete len:1105 (+),score=260.24 TRINITY_DN8549_c0_g1_i1:215-3529(+)